jgi:methylation protein EvaC
VTESGRKNQMDVLKCRICDSKNIKMVLDFGEVALAGAFLKSVEFDQEELFPQQLYFCKDCSLLQIINKVNPKVLFNDYFYFSSAIKTLRDHFTDFAQEITKKFLNPAEASVLEIGCNDGVLLKPFAKLGINKLIGVDPSTNVVNTINVSGIQTINEFFTENLALRIKEELGYIDLVIANNVFAHIDDIHDVIKGIKQILANDGVFIFEVHYLASLIDELQYDMIYHEHLFYYSLLTLENLFANYELEIFDVKSVPIHAGSMRYYVRRKGFLDKISISKSVVELRNNEIESGYNKETVFLRYAEKIDNTKTDLMILIDHIKQVEKNKIVGYGASGRANTLIQFCGINAEHIDYMIDDSKAKIGFFTPGSHFLIKSSENLLIDQPSYVLVFAWSFFSEIVSKNMEYLRNGGKMIIPLPSVKIIYYEDGAIKEKQVREILSSLQK